MRSGFVSGVAALALVASLSACDDLDQALGIDKSATNTTTTTSTATNTVTPVAPGATPSKPSGGDLRSPPKWRRCVARPLCRSRSIK